MILSKHAAILTFYVSFQYSSIKGDSAMSEVSRN